MNRTFNYTGRKRIPREKVKLVIAQEKAGQATFSAAIDLAELGLPSDSTVYVEAYHRTEYFRYPFGKVGGITPPPVTNLAHLGLQPNVKFRIIVVDESSTRGLILAAADGLVPEGRREKDKGAKSILPVALEELGRQIWILDYEDGGPTLILNSSIPGIEQLATSDARFFEYVYPTVLRQVLTHMVFIEGVTNTEDPAEPWHADWIAFARKYAPDIPELCKDNKKDFADDSVLQWISDVGECFADSHADKWDHFVKIEEKG